MKKPNKIYPEQVWIKNRLWDKNKILIIKVTKVVDMVTFGIVLFDQNYTDGRKDWSIDTYSLLNGNQSTYLGKKICFKCNMKRTMYWENICNQYGIKLESIRL